ncbi:hypothetical protein CGI56_24600 [Vibrio parahaemolyticus]|nr:hypothetical protein CGI56_24600 [Vibrio parahaemolyticus]
MVLPTQLAIAYKLEKAMETLVLTIKFSCAMPMALFASIINKHFIGYQISIKPRFCRYLRLNHQTKAVI